MKSKRKKERNLIPSMKENKRYLKLGTTNKKLVEGVILDYIGILGYSKAGLMWIGSILAVNREQLNNIKAALELGNVSVLRVSGTLKGLKG